VAEREIAEAQATKLEWREKAAENAQLKKALEEVGQRILQLENERSDLQAEKEAIEADLDKNIDDTLPMRNQSFFQASARSSARSSARPTSSTTVHPHQVTSTLTWMCSRV